ncbi:hypothetical protein V9T40_000806 [Parthenolecanium corni]|uniref:Ral guanine nucleotide dissociation stimulator-like 1 n=1 Tax=Parthenolecanium corni TaxID=536013 RepID=A0AAN9TN26_9HEMI
MNLDTDNSNQTGYQLWGEERTDDAIYIIYLKKVRYSRPMKSISESQDGISHLEWEKVRVKFIKAGTLERLVESLTSDDGELESTYCNIFFTTYRTFATPEQVLSLILDRYEKLINNVLDLPEATTEQLKKSVVVAIRMWLDLYPDDFRDPPLHTTLRRLILFAQQHLPGSDLHLKAEHKFQRLVNETVTDGYNLYSYDDRICLSKNEPHAVSYGLTSISPKLFAEQLTRIDVELFKKVIPHQCLGAVWSREKSRSTDAATVLATISQFNSVSYRVMSTILMPDDLKPHERAKIISIWIDIAQELRILKNFSSLKAIISRLQSLPIYRLQKIWQMVSKEKVEIFKELAGIFSEDNNQCFQRELLIREGTAKFAETAGENDRHMPKIIQRLKQNAGNVSNGTVPYLGTFLTDLTMIDAANPDYVEGGLINFEKKRKEFEVLALIKLLQGAAKGYYIVEDVGFVRWFDSILILEDVQADKLSCQIEPDNNNHYKGENGFSKSSKSRGHSKNDSIASNSSGSSCQFYDYSYLTDSMHSSSHDSLHRINSFSQISSSSSASSVTSNSTSNQSASVSAVDSSPARSSFPQDSCIIRVKMETNLAEADGIVLYKSIMLNNNERTHQVIRNAMAKLGIVGNPENYTLSQILPHKEFPIPHNANVYYAINTTYDPNFILRKKTTTQKKSS